MGNQSRVRSALPILMLAREQLGAVGVIGVGAIIGAILAYMFYVKALEMDVRKLASQEVGLRAELTALSDVGRKVKADGSLARQQDVSENKSVEDLLRGIYQAGIKHNVQLFKGEYAKDSVGPGYTRYKIKLPLTVGYKSLRYFINDVVASVPNVVLGGLVIDRESVGSALVRATVQFDVYVRETR